MKERIIRFGLPVAAIITSIGIGFAGVTSAQTTATNGVGASYTRGAGAQTRSMRVRPVVRGTITAIDGTVLTVNSSEPNAPLKTYTVETSGAALRKVVQGAAPVDMARGQLAVGDTVVVRGTASGTSVNATEVVDGVPPRMDGRGPGMGKGEGAFGTVSAINGNTITLTRKNGTTYTVDASTAKVSKMSSVTVGDIKVGDTLGVRGTVSGTNVSAADILDGIPQGPMGR